MTAVTALSVESREVLAQQTARTTAQHLAFAVRQRDAGLVEQLLLPLSRQELVTLAVVLADQAPTPRSRPEDGIFDEIAVARAAAGERVPLTVSERDTALRLMDRRGTAWRVIAERFGMSVQTVKQVLAAPAPVQEALGETTQPAGSGTPRAAETSSDGAVA